MSSVPTMKSSGGSFESMVAEAAYYKSEQRGFAPGFEMDDWLEAERELSAVGSAQKPRHKPATRKKKSSVNTS